MQQHYAGYLFMLLASVVAAFMGSLSRYCFDNGVTPIELAFYRTLIAGALYFAHASIQGRVRIPPRAAGIFAAFGICIMAMLSLSYLYAVRIAGVSTTTILLYTAPAWVALFSRILFKEALPPLKLLALFLALVGATLACLSGGALPGGVSPFGMALALFCGLVYACQYIALAYLLRNYSAPTFYSVAMPAGGLMMLPFVEFTTHSIDVWLVILIIGVVCTYLTFLLYAMGIKRLTPTTAAVIANTEPILAALVAWIWWGEFFPPTGWIGAALVISAVFLVVFSQRRQLPPDLKKEL